MYKVWKGRNKSISFTDDTLVYIENAKESINKLQELELIAELNNVTKHKVNFISRFQLKALGNRIKMPYIKYLGINLMQILQNENYDTLIKEIREDLPK